MKKAILLLFLATFSGYAYSQDGVTFKIESLSKPKKPLQTVSYDRVYENLIMLDADLNHRDVEKDSITIPYNILARDDYSKDLVFFGYHPFFNGMYQAYADHRPFVLSPDMIWLLISQGFARHVNANPELLRHHFVDFEGKTTLIVSSNNSLENNKGTWEDIFPEFSRQIALNTKGDLVNILTSDFSTTTSVERIATEITIMESVKPYFEFVHIYIICGIPKITLLGTPDDWRRVLDKTRHLAKYDLQWWTSELEPLLNEFINASEGRIDKTFWRNMFKFHTSKQYGAPNVIDGWIVKFFPYYKNGKRSSLESVSRSIGGGKTGLPEEIVKVDLKHIETNENGETTETPLELWAGFVGLEQDQKTYALTPKVGWMIRKKDTEEGVVRQSIHDKANSDYGGIHIRVSEIPASILSLKEIKSLTVYFIDNIKVPDELSKVKIKYLALWGDIDEAEIPRLKELFPDTELRINWKLIK